MVSHFGYGQAFPLERGEKGSEWASIKTKLRLDSLSPDN